MVQSVYIPEFVDDLLFFALGRVLFLFDPCKISLEIDDLTALFLRVRIGIRLFVFEFEPCFSGFFDLRRKDIRFPAKRKNTLIFVGKLPISDVTDSIAFFLCSLSDDRLSRIRAIWSIDALTAVFSDSNAAILLDIPARSSSAFSRRHLMLFISSEAYPTAA